MNAEMRCSFDNGAGGSRSGAMTCRAWQAACGGPATVAVGDDGNVDGAWRGDARLDVCPNCRELLLVVRDG
jgi:hypothetical protein